MKQVVNELKQLEKDLKAYSKKLKIETKDLRQRYKKLSKKVANLMDKTNDPDKLSELDKPMFKCDNALYDMESYLSKWDYYH